MNDADCARPATHASVPPWTASAPWVLGLLAVWLLATAGLRPLLLPDEARYAEVAREMLAGDGWVPLLNGLPFFHKPPLTYWIDLGGMRLFGITPFAARMGPALGAWLMGAALWLSLRQRQGARTAGIALVVLATSPFVYIGGQYANHDMLVAGTITAAVLCLARALDCRAANTAGVSGGTGGTGGAGVTGGTGALRWLVAGWAACGLAVLSKGLIGVVLPALIVGPWLLWQRRWRDVFWLLHPLGLAAFAVVALPWMLLMQGRYPGFFDYFIVEQHFRRYATLGFNNQQPAWFLIAVLPLLTLPWSAAALPALRRLWPGGARAPAPPGAGGMTGLMVWWVVAVLGFFSLPASKLVGYIMPALAPWCLLLAAPLAASRWWRPIAGLAAVVSVGTVVALAWQAPKSNRDIGLELRQRAAPDDRVVFVDDPFHDVAFYARLSAPALLASAWDDPEIPRRDNWRKEIADATRFDSAGAAATLLHIDRLPTLVCQGRRVWLVTTGDRPAALAAVPGARLVVQGRHAQLWLAAPRACPAGQ